MVNVQIDTYDFDAALGLMRRALEDKTSKHLDALLDAVHSIKAADPEWWEVETITEPFGLNLSGAVMRLVVKQRWMDFLADLGDGPIIFSPRSTPG